MLRANLDTSGTDRLLGPLARVGLPPTGWTLLALVVAFAGFAALWAHWLALGLALFILSGFLDVVDGAVARATGKSSSSGAFIDGVVDRYVELLLILGLAIYLDGGSFLHLPTEVWIVLLIFGSLMTSFVRAYADHRNLLKDPALLKRMGGLLERGERMALLYAGMALGLYDLELLIYSIALTTILANATAVQRIFFALRHGKG